jgi:hypothetical protein
MRGIAAKPPQKRRVMPGLFYSKINQIFMYFIFVLADGQNKPGKPGI